MDAQPPQQNSSARLDARSAQCRSSTATMDGVFLLDGAQRCQQLGADGEAVACGARRRRVL